MSELLKELTGSEFNSVIAKGVVLVDFWAPWCGPCRMQTPILEKVAASLDSQVVIGKINVDDEQDIAANFGIQSIPTLLLFKDGKLVKKMVGLQSEAALLSQIKTL